MLGWQHSYVAAAKSSLCLTSFGILYAKLQKEFQSNKSPITVSALTSVCLALVFTSPVERTLR
jgi:uncharacterized membrane protein YjjB (DUF3815 family)